MVTVQRSLGRYVPRFASEWELDAPGRRWREVDGTLCFLDISGFTNLSERLAHRGRIGAEELTDVLSRAFGSMLDLAYERGGALLKFGGDALLFLFTGTDHAMQAAAAAVEMRGTLRQSRTWQTSAGRLNLGMSVGIHSGTVHLFRAGESHHELIITGPAATATTQMEKTADAGEIVVFKVTRDALPTGATAPTKSDGWVLRWRKPPVSTVGAVPRRKTRGDRLENNLSVAVREHLAAGKPEPEHRIATVGFVRFEGVDALLRTNGAAAVADDLHRLVVATQQAVDAEGVTFLSSDIDADGGKLILVAGVPVGRPDDEGRMLRAVRAIADERLPFVLRIGVNRGHVFAGEVGTRHRATYTVMGDTVNLAARLMASAAPGQIYASRAVLDLSRTLFETTALEPFHVKGKTEPVQAYVVGARGEDRSEQVRTELPFIGRADELAGLAGILRADRSSGEAIEIVGEKGIGKSRLVEEALNTVPDVARLILRAEVYRMTMPYHAFRTPMRKLLGIQGRGAAAARSLRSVVKRVAPEQAELAPLLADLVDVDINPTPATASIEPEFRPARLADLTGQLLQRLLPGRTAIVIEDANWLDDASVGLLRHLEAALSEHPWVLVIARRDEPGGFTPKRATTLHLGPLEEASSRELVVEATEAAPLRPHTIDTIVDRTGGNPLFLEEIVRALRTSANEEDLPESLDDVVGAQIDALPPLPRRLLQYASVLGRMFPRWLLDAVLDEEGERLDPGTDPALENFLIASDGALQFRHAVVRDAAYGRLSFRKRRELHLRAGVAAENRAGDDPDAAADLLGLHFTLAGEAERAWKYSRLAGDRAKELYANIDAATHYERALEAARRMPSIADEDAAAVFTSLGEVRERAGMYGDALEAFDRALRLRRDDPIARATLRLRRAQVHQRTGKLRSALRELSVGNTALDGEAGPEAGTLRVQLLAYRAILRQAQQRPLEALRLAERVVDDARTVGEQSALAGAYTVMDWAHLVLGRPEKAVYLPDALAIYEEIDHLIGQASALNNLGARAFLSGDWGSAADLYQRARSVYLRAGDVVRAASVGANAGEILAAQGRRDEAAAVLRDSARTMRTAGVIEEAAFAETHLARTLAADGDMAAAEEMLRNVLAELRDIGLHVIALVTAIYLAEVQRREGDPSGALETLSEAETVAGPAAAMLAPASTRVRCGALADLGRFEEALAEVADGLVAAEQQGLVYERALLIVTEARIARLAGREEDSGRVESALADLQRLGVPTRPEDLVI